ncbi:hypothetical protein [Microterricola viridarii]|uniref:hypothetical protein n=1 Tax=Microterricola viridarii TaxID=412690 RepID=UPI001F25E44B|nr:hypothetical protein [Microterricola viridarii]
MLLVFPRGRDALAQAGGTIARLVDAGSSASVLSSAGDADADAGLWAMGARNVAVAGNDARAAVADALDGQRSSAVVVPAPLAGAEHSAASELVTAALEEAAARHLPVYLAVSGRMPAGQRLIAVDVSDHLDAKSDALAALPGVSVVERTVTVDGQAPRLLGATEQFVLIGGGQPEPADTPSVSSRIGAAVLGFLVGALFAAMGTVAHQSTAEIFGITVPWGLLLGLVGFTALLVGLRLVLHDRVTVLFTALGALVTIFVLSLRSTGGSVLIPEGALGLAWTMGPVIIAAIVLAWPRLPARPSPRA